MKKTPIAVLGTGSDVGKSMVAAAVCKILADRGEAVAPFKAQNMSNNSGITPDGLEMGRAQIVQAEAAGIAPHVDMNPILLKPTGEKHSQVIVLGKVSGNRTAMDYHKRKNDLFKIARDAFDRLAARYQRVVLEGAGSCAEVNLMRHDIVNFPMAEHANAQVILVADIHRGGVFAQIVGTLDCLPDPWRERIKGIIINRFRGDIALFRDGVEWIEKKTGKKVLGVLPWYTHFRIDAEDSVEIEHCHPAPEIKAGSPAVGIIRLPYIANFTDFHVLRKIEGLQTVFIDRPDRIQELKAVIIPGSKNTREDLKWLKQHFETDLNRYVRKGGHILGICGGYQMLGKYVDDPGGVEGSPGRTKALNLLPVSTVLKFPKTTTVSDFEWDGAIGKGYEIHMGQTRLEGGRPLIRIQARNSIPVTAMDGCLGDAGNVAGTYMHGLFDSPQVLGRWFKMIGLEGAGLCGTDMVSDRLLAYERLKTHFQSHIDLGPLV